MVLLVFFTRIVNTIVTFILWYNIPYPMSKQTRIKVLGGGGKQIALSAPTQVQMRMRELYEVISKYAVYNDYAFTVAYAKKKLQELEEALAAENMAVFWQIYNKTAKVLLQNGIVLPSYVKYSFRLG
jgi:hypothetical protein